jgi:RNA polymerase sigma factor (sigma-70 family)
MMPSHTSPEIVAAAWTAPPPDSRLSLSREALGWPQIYTRLQRDPEDGDAFAWLERRVTRWVERQLLHPSLRAHHEDVVADTCAAVLTSVDDAYGAETFSAFVYGLYLNARRRAFRIAREPAVPLGALDHVEHTPSHPDPDEILLLGHCLKELPDRERRAIELRYLSDASTAEIARALNVSESNARRIVFNGLRRLRKSMRATWPAGRA